MKRIITRKNKSHRSETKNERKLQKTEPVNFPEHPCSSKNMAEPKYALEVKPKVESIKKRKIKHPACINCRFVDCQFSIELNSCLGENMIEKRRSEHLKIFVEFLSHVKCHLVALLENQTHLAKDDLLMLVHFEHKIESEWRQVVVESNIDSQIPISCAWTFGTSSDRAKCNYKLKNFHDFLTHYYFHCSMERQLALGSKYIPDVANWRCKGRGNPEDISESFNKIYQKCVAKYPFSCKWTKPVGCSYMSFVPYLFSCHIRAKTDITHCCWEKCNSSFKSLRACHLFSKVQHIDLVHLKNYSFEHRSTYYPNSNYYTKILILTFCQKSNFSNIFIILVFLLY